MNDKVLLGGILHESLVNGPGIRRVLFSQICSHKCEGCFNPDSWSDEKGEWFDMDTIIDDIIQDDILSGVTFSGGDPIEQADKFAYIAEELKSKTDNPHFTIWCYTGYTIEELFEKSKNNIHIQKLLKNIDVLVDGKFLISQSSSLKFKGSSNQRIIDVPSTLKNNTITIFPV